MARIVVIGGTGLIGSALVTQLTEQGHTAIAAAPSTGVNSLTGEGLDAALADADVLVDVANSPSFEEQAVLDFFTTSTTNLLAAARSAGVGHVVALSVVGTDRMPDSAYIRAKVAQEKLIRESGVPYTIVRATQFFEFAGGIAGSATVDGVVRLPSAPIQPIASVEVAAAVCRAAVGAPADDVVEVGGPEVFPMHEFVRKALTHNGDPRTVVADDTARYFGAALDEKTLVTGEGATIAEIRFADWLTR